MADEKSTVGVRCPNCDQEVSEVQLQTCQMCRNLFCQRCGVFGYGRLFCGPRCRDMFFFGDGEESEKDF